MYPLIFIGNTVRIYTFGLFMIIAWGLFFYLLHRGAMKKWFSKHIFISIITFTLAIFLFWRIFYTLSEWRTEQFIFHDLINSGNVLEFLKKFFVTDNYNLSFAWGVIGFFVTFLVLTKNTPKDRPKYLDIIVQAFLPSAAVWYIGALLGGQLYGIPMNSFISITYTDKNSPVPFQNPVFPLPIVYIFLCIVLSTFLYRLSRKYPLPNGFIGYLGLGIFSGFTFLLDFLNGSSDAFGSIFHLSLNQLVALGFIALSILWLWKTVK